MGQVALEAFGWLGSAVLVFSVLQSRFLRFRVVNGVASAMLVAYNGLLGVWPAVAMNCVLVVIDVYFIVTLVGAKRASKAFAFAIEPATGEAVGWFLARHGSDVAAFHPGLAARLGEAGTQAALIFHEDAAIGVAVFRRDGDGAAELLADYVIPSYRDYAPGVFVYSAAGPLAQAGVSRAWMDAPGPGVTGYLTRLGFREAKGRWSLPVPVLG
ncbi:MAG: hypothetical protein FWC46_04950 [Actinomycetia bacterium]|nr:hypothetical protein [Actinomycetes bacterium]